MAKKDPWADVRGVDKHQGATTRGSVGPPGSKGPGAYKPPMGGMKSIATNEAPAKMLSGHKMQGGVAIRDPKWDPVKHLSQVAAKHMGRRI